MPIPTETQTENRITPRTADKETLKQLRFCPVCRLAVKSERDKEGEDFPAVACPRCYGPLQDFSRRNAALSPYARRSYRVVTDSTWDT